MKTLIRKENKITFIDVQFDNFEVALADVGASLYGIKFHNDEMILRVKNSDDYLIKDLYLGKTIGRVCGRMTVDPFEVQGQKYHLQDNNNKASLHGGFDGISNKIFKYEIKENKNNVKVTFSYLSKDGEAGYPGNMLITVIYVISQDNIKLTFRAKTDRPCLLSLTNHAYFCLGEKQREKLSLQLSTNKCVEFDERLFPVRLVDVPDIWNFTNEKPLSQTGDVDNYFLFDKEKKILLKSSKYQLTIDTDFPGVQLYTDNFVMDAPVTSSELKQYRSIAIEPENNPLDKQVLQPDDNYEKNIEYRFEKL